MRVFGLCVLRAGTAAPNVPVGTRGDIAVVDDRLVSSARRGELPGVSVMKTGFVFSGAGARIPQLYALARAVVEGTYPDPARPGRTGPPVAPDVIAGASSGSLNAVAVSAILSGRFSWDQYREVLVDLRNSPSSPGAKRDRTIYAWLPGDIGKGYVLQTESRLLPHHLLHATLSDVVQNRMGLETLGDIDPRYPVVVSAVSRETGRTLRLASDDPACAKFPVVDVLMASTAIPVAFPQRPLPKIGPCVDGGTGRDSVPVDGLADRGCDEIWIMCKQLEDPLAESVEFMLEAVPEPRLADELDAVGSTSDDAPTPNDARASESVFSEVNRIRDWLLRRARPLPTDPGQRALCREEVRIRYLRLSDLPGAGTCRHCLLLRARARTEVQHARLRLRRRSDCRYRGVGEREPPGRASGVATSPRRGPARN